MTLAQGLRTTGVLARDTFRQALSTRLFWIMLAVSGMAILLCLSMGVEGEGAVRVQGEAEWFGSDGKPLAGPNPDPGSLTLGFGVIRVPLFRDRESMIQFLQVLLGKWVAGAVGILLALVWTAGFLPEFLHPGAATVLLAKPVPRWLLLAGKSIGVLAFVTLQAVLFIGGTWLALGVRVGVWPPGYLVCIPILLVHFVIVYSFSMFLAVTTRNTVVCVLGSVVFWFLCLALNQGRHAAVVLPEVAPEAKLSATGGSGAPWLVEAGYWLLPKPTDLLMVLDGALDAGRHVVESPVLRQARAQGAFHPALSVATSLLFALAVMLLTARQFARHDY